LLVAAASGLFLSLSLPPAGQGWVAFLAPLPLLWLVRTTRPRRGFALGAVFGLAYFGAVLYWILLFGELAWGALVALSALFTAVFGLLAPAIWRSRHPVWSSLGLAGLWTVLEWGRGAWPLGGFGWGQVGSTQTGNPSLLRLASVGGVWAITFVVMLVACLLLLALERAAERRPAAIGYALVSVALVVAPVAIAFPSAEGPTVRVAAIQVDVRSARSLSGADEDIAVARMNIDLHRKLAADPPDLAVWGEGSLDPGATSDPSTVEAVRTVIRDVGAPTLAGAVVNDPDGEQRTSALLFDGSGALVDRYDKVKLVPFGEYVPFRRWLGWIDAIDQIPVDRAPGAAPHTVRTDGLPSFGTPICYENSFPSIERAMVREGAAFFVLTTNNASYEMTAASRQHVLMSQLRAVETGRWFVHAAVSGLTAIVDPRGEVVAERGLFVPGITRQTIRASDAETPYVRFGDWVVWLSFALAVGVFAVPRGRRTLGRDPEPLPEHPRTLVILPTYDEGRTIGAVLDGLLALEDRVDVLVVDDASPDGTAGVVEAHAGAQERIRLVRRSAKSGLASAYLVGFRRALDEGYELVVEMDADLSHQPDELPRLLGAARACDLVIGSRYVAGGAVMNWSRARLGLSRGGNLYARWVLGFPLRDATSGFRAYRRALLAHLCERPVRSEGYGFQIELAYRAWNDGYVVGEAPITFREREHGRSKISRRIVLEALWEVAAWGVWARFRAS
jgi:apolipoprotein N-acyltransferase